MSLARMPGIQILEVPGTPLPEGLAFQAPLPVKNAAGDF
jgi:hypothetical protein